MLNPVTRNDIICWLLLALMFVIVIAAGVADCKRAEVFTAACNAKHGVTVHTMDGDRLCFKNDTILEIKP